MLEENCSISLPFFVFEARVSYVIFSSKWRCGFFLSPGTSHYISWSRSLVLNLTGIGIWNIFNLFKKGSVVISAQVFLAHMAMSIE